MSTAVSTRRLRRSLVAAGLAAAFCVPLVVSAWDDGDGQPPADDPALLDAETMPLAARSLLLSATDTGSGLVAVGERGHVLLSGDGREWRQAGSVPTRSTLTAVSAADGLLWAVGHDGVIIHSADGGESWERQRVAPWTVGSFDPEAGVPLLDVVFFDAAHGIAVGAFSLMLETFDGGASWQAQFLSELVGEEDEFAFAEVDGAVADPDDFIDDDDDDDDWGFSADDLMLDAEDDPHLNAIARTGTGALLVAGERGALFRSRDGESWERLALPYEGSMFGVLAWEDEHVMVFGLRGNVFESFDLGESWQALDSGTESSLMGGVALPGGGALLVGNEGRMVHRGATGEPFRRLTHTTDDGETPVLSTAWPIDGGFLLLGARGVDHTGELD